MTAILARAELQPVSGMAADVVVNDFVFAGTSTAAAMAAEVESLLIAFYYNATASGNAVGHYLGSSRKRTALTSFLKFYDISAVLGGGVVGSPIRTTPMTLIAGLNTTDQAEEVAAVISIAADFSGAVEESGSTRPRSRRRGRLYIGPLIQSSGSTDASGHFRPTTQFRNTLKEAAARLRDDTTALASDTA